LTLKNLFFVVFATVVMAGMSFAVTTSVYASSTHMTFHNLSDTPAALAVNDYLLLKHCNAQPNGGTCEVGTEYIWYIIWVYYPSFENSTKRIEKLGVYGDCNVYFEGSAGDYKVSHHCAGAEAAGLKPPTQNQTK
jgi:hypothetical protein